MHRHDQPKPVPDVRQDRARGQQLGVADTECASAHKPMKCGFCGELGHTRSSKVCPRYNEPEEVVRRARKETERLERLERKQEQDVSDLMRNEREKKTALDLAQNILHMQRQHADLQQALLTKEDQTIQSIAKAAAAKKKKLEATKERRRLLIDFDV